MSDIAERLLRTPLENASGYMLGEAADEICRLRAENVRLREALRPFADVPLDGYEFSSALLRTADLRAARAAMGESDE